MNHSPYTLYYGGHPKQTGTFCPVVDFGSAKLVLPNGKTKCQNSLRGSTTSMKEPIENKRARFDYDILETFEAGLELLGTEVQSIKHGRMNLSSTYVLLRNGQPMLFNADIPPYQPKNAPGDYNPTRTRRLLLTAKEIQYLTGKTEEKGLTLVPLKVYTKHQRIKVLIGLAKSRKEHDKREAIKKREDWKQIRKGDF